MAEKEHDDRKKDRKVGNRMNRRNYLKLAGLSGAGVGTGLGAGALGSGFTTPAHAASVLDDFEDGDIDEYTGHTSNYTVEQSSELEGSYRLKCSDPYDQLASTSTHGRGYRYEYRFIAGSGSGSKPGLMTCIQDGSNPVEGCYWLQPDVPNDKLILYVRENGSGERLEAVYVSSGLSEGTEYRGALELRSDTVKGILYDANGNQLVSTGEISDTTHSDGHYGFYTGAGQPAYYDYVTKESLGSDSSSSPEYVVVDDFEPPKDLSDHYRFKTGESNASAVSDDSAVYSGSNTLAPSYSGRGVLEHSDEKVEMFSLPGDGLANYPSAGDTFSAYVLCEGGLGDTFVAYGVQDSLEDYYWLNVDFTNEKMHLFKQDNGEYMSIGSSGQLSFDADTWYYVTVHWGTNGTHEIYLEDLHENVIGEVSAEDSEYTSGGVGFVSSFPPDQSETFYWDFYMIGEQPTSGGWGTEVRGRTDGPDYGRDNNAYYLQDFKYFFDYSGETNTDVHTFHIGGFYHTYTITSGDDNITHDEVLSERDIDGVETELSVTDGDGTLRDDVRLDRYNPNTKMMYLNGGSDYDSWVEEHLNSTATREEIHDNAVNADTLDPNPDSIGAIDIVTAALTGISFWYPPAGYAAGVASGASLVDKFTNESECGQRTNPEDNSDHVIFDPCDDIALMAYVMEYELDLTSVPSDEYVQLSINQSVSIDRGIHDGTDYYAPGTANWEIVRPGGTLGPYFYLNDSSTS
jgi:hypothetical protein